MPTIIGKTPLDRKTHWSWMLRAWILRHPTYNYRHTPDADAETFAKRHDWVRWHVDLRPLLN